MGGFEVTQNITVLSAILIALFYWFKGVRLGYTFGVVTLFSPLPAALFVGLVFHNVPVAMVVGASLQLMYLGLLAPGGAMPSDPTIAALVACTVAITTGMDSQAAVALAVPVGLLGVQLMNLEFLINGFFAHMADKYAENADTRGIYLSGLLYPNLAKIVIYAVPLFLAIYFGTPYVKTIMDAIPAPLMNGLSVAGAMLPALGFAIIVSQIGLKYLLPYFLAGFFLMQYSQIGTMPLAIAGIFIAYLHVLFTNSKKEAM
jgi:PTS system mannose-specific IIC component